MTTPTVPKTDLDRAVEVFIDLLENTEPTWVGIPFVDLHDECDPNPIVDDAARAVFGHDLSGQPWLDVLNAVTEGYEAWRLSQPWAINQLEHTIAKAYALTTLEQTAEPVHGHQFGVTVYMPDHCNLVITDEWAEEAYTIEGTETHGGWTVGIYGTREWTSGEGVTAYAEVKSHAALLTLVEALTHLQPEGTNWAAWASQWISDSIASGTLTDTTIDPDPAI